LQSDIILTFSEDESQTTASYAVSDRSDDVVRKRAPHFRTIELKRLSNFNEGLLRYRQMSRHAAVRRRRMSDTQQRANTSRGQGARMQVIDARDRTTHVFGTRGLRG